jgi:hypothetical protein
VRGGDAVTTPNLGSLPIDLPRLLETRMLVQANSGGGKSWCLRRMLEQTAGQVQQIVIDPEGEFASLRERFDYIVCAPNGADAVANPQTAAALARALWKAGTSAILDVYELKAHERVLSVRRFLESLVNAPRAMWHPTLVVLDEAHVFAPQVGSAESLGAVVDLATRGRKRGLALIAATQRLSKLHKDVAAELLNKLVGRTGLDVDVQRAADELGMNRKDATEALRNLAPGEFFAYGPALARAVERTRIGGVQTTHPKTGHRELIAPPPPSPKVLAQLAKLEGVQREVEREQQTTEQLLAELAALRRKLTVAEKAASAPAAKPEVARPVPATFSAATLRIVANAIAALQAIETASGADVPAAPPARSQRPAGPVAVANGTPRTFGPVAEGVTAPQQRIIDVLLQLEQFGIDAPDKPMVAAHAGVSPTSGGYFNNLGRLRSAGLIEYPQGGTVALTDAGRKLANQPTKKATLEDLHASWLAIVPAPQAAILGALIEIYPASIPKDDLADRVGVSRTSGGFFNNLGRLRTLGAIEYPNRGEARATDILFPKGRA